MPSALEVRDADQVQRRLLARVDAELAGLSSSYFALVMATGIVSIGAHLLDVPSSPMRCWPSTSPRSWCCGS
jgi:hypothetical protein